MVVSIAEGPSRLRAAAAAVGTLPRVLRAELRKQTRAVVLPLVQAEARRQAGGDVRAQRLAARARVTFRRDVPGVAFGGTASVTRDGTPGRVLAHRVEYGSQGDRVTTVEARSPAGKRYTYRRNTTAAWAPQRPAGTFVAPAVEATQDRVLEVWTDVVEQQLLAALDEGS